MVSISTQQSFQKNPSPDIGHGLSKGSKSLLIAEIGNCHFGSIKRAKELIKAAHNSGADLIKGQAFHAKDIQGSMPPEFYQKCEFSVQQYIDLIEYARDIGNDLFYSIFSPGFEQLSMYQIWHKTAGIQTRNGAVNEHHDIANMIISVPRHVDLQTLYHFKHAEILHVSDYLVTDPQLEQIPILTNWLKRPAGYSDHTEGVHYAIVAYKEYGADIIEKHFCMKKNESFNGVVFRDTTHGATPDEFEKLARVMSE